MKIDLVQAAVQ